MQPCLIFLSLLGALAASDDRLLDSRMIIRPDAFKTLVNPDCSHCRDEAKRRAGELRADDRVLCWIRDTKGHYNGGAVPFRFFLNPYRVISDSYGVFVYDPDAGYARGFAPSYDFSFYGWRHGVMVMKHKDGTLYSCLTGTAFAGPGKGQHLQPVSTIVSDWGFWLKHYPDSVAYHMYDKYQPVALPHALNEHSVASRGTVDTRLPADEMVLGVFGAGKAKAYPLSSLAKAGMIEDEILHDPTAHEPIVVIWEPATKTAAAYASVALPAPATAGPALTVTFVKDQGTDGSLLRDKETGSHWDITGRAVAGSLKGSTLKWLDSTQVKWFAWSAEYPNTSIYQPREEIHK